MVTLTIKELLETIKVFHTLNGTPLEFKLAYRLNKIDKKIGPEIEAFIKHRDAIFKKHGVLVKPDGIEIPTGKEEIVEKELTPILNQEIKLDVSLIPEVLLENSVVKLAPRDLASLEKFIDYIPITNKPTEIVLKGESQGVSLQSNSNLKAPTN
jgi:hypothetical protein